MSSVARWTEEENLEESKKLLQEIETAKAKLELPEVKEKSKCETIIDIIGTILCGVIVISVALLLFGVG